MLRRWILLCLLLLMATGAHAKPAALVLIVGGGPDPENNQVAIERNVRYLHRLLDPSVPRLTLFADGRWNHATVLYEKAAPRALSDAELLLATLFGDDAEGLSYRRPQISHLDGAARQAPLAQSFRTLRRRSAAAPETSIVLYFTGHGSPGAQGDNIYNLWDGEELTARQLARHIATLPPQAPVTLVMVQCYAGGFGNVLFEGGNAKAQPVNRDIVGFFAATKDRMAAGCTPEVDEAYYRDFTSYFFAALSGQDRLGRPVGGADYDRDGHVGMNEAFYYTLAHDESIDVPVCTSDVFLRRYETIELKQLGAIPYAEVLRQASPGQKAALDALSQQLGLSGDDRLAKVIEQLSKQPSLLEVVVDSFMQGYHRGFNSSRLLRLEESARDELTGRWPELWDPFSRHYKKQRAAALAELNQQAKQGRHAELLRLIKESDAMAGNEAEEIHEAKLLRFVVLCKSIVLARRLEQNAPANVKARYRRLVQAEARELPGIKREVSLRATNR